MSEVTLDVRELPIPLVLAPMAGGPSTPELAAAVSATGALGFLAAGYLTPERFADDIARTRALTGRPFGVNLFVPRPSVVEPEQLARYRERLAADAARYGTELGIPHADDDAWDAKLAVVEAMRPAVVSFTFGVPRREVTSALHAAGVLVGMTVTTPAEAETAENVGADFLVVQGPEAGGHRGTFDPAATPATDPLEVLLAQVLSRTALPVVAAGGVGARADVERLLTLGAAAVQAGTAFLRTDEAGTRAAHAAALADTRFDRTVVTTVFSGRYARGLENAFHRDHVGHTPLGYPEVHQLTSPMRAAAAAAGDADRLNLWAGTGFRHARTGPAADVVAALAPHTPERSDV
jgi:nitronate monooxygenase